MNKLEISGTNVTIEEVESAIRTISYQKMGKKFTICHIELINGHEVIGVSAIVNEKKFDHLLGKDIALQNAKNEIWNHMESVLQDRLSN